MYAYLALAALQLVGGFQQANITRQNGELQNNIAQLNAHFAQVDAFNDIAKGQGNAARYQETINATDAAGIAAEAGSGQDVNFGTASSVSAANKIAGNSNTLQIIRDAQNQALGAQTRALNIGIGGQQAELQSQLNASSQESQGVMGAIQTGISYLNFQASTGKGFTAHTGTDTPVGYGSLSNRQPATISDDGSGFSSTYTGPSNGPGWYSDPDSLGPGFYGYGSRSAYASGGGHLFNEPNEPFLGGASFTNETGG